MTEFIPGKKLSGLFYEQAVRPLIDRITPDLRYAAALIGDGSEVLGYDDRISGDHDWGPRLTLFLTEADIAKSRERIHDYLANNLPFEFMGYPTNFGEPDPEDNGTRLLKTALQYPINHRVEIFTVRDYIKKYLDFDIADHLTAIDWLTIPHCKLLGLARAEIFRDQIGLRDILLRFEFYPHDLWLYMLACGWKRIEQEEHLLGRADQVGDSLGAGLIAARLVRDIVRLVFLMRKQYPPYPKWLGTAFGNLENTGELQCYLDAVLNAAAYTEREQNLCAAYSLLVKLHNDLNLTEPLSDDVSNFFNRPFKVINAGRIVTSLIKQIKVEEVRRLTEKPLIGNIDFISDNTDFVTNQLWRKRLRRLYE